MHHFPKNVLIYNPVRKLMEKRQMYQKVAFLMYTEMVNFRPQS